VGFIDNGWGVSFGFNEMIKGCNHNQMSQKNVERPPKLYKNYNFVRYILWCHFNAMLIIILGFGFNK
jgi:hypothetical protein